MNLQQALADLIGAEVVERDVEFNGRTTKMHFRLITGESADEMQLASLTEDNKLDRRAFAEMPSREIAASLCDADGKLIATFDEVRAIPAALRKALHAIVSEVNGVGAKKSSPTESGSGTPSLSDLEEPSVT
jgi:hypothetical protein